MHEEIGKNAEQVSEIFKILSNKYRLLIVCYLAGGEKTVSEILAKIGSISQSALSQHLALMKAHKILASKKDGQHIYYFIEDQKILQILQVIKTEYCDHW